MHAAVLDGADGGQVSLLQRPRPQDIRPFLQLGEPTPVTPSIYQMILLPSAHAPCARRETAPRLLLHRLKFAIA